MRVILHGITDHIRDLIVTTILQFFHGVKDPSLNRLQPIVRMRNGSFKDYIGCIVEKPISIHIIHIDGIIVSIFFGQTLSQSFRIEPRCGFSRLLFSILLVFFFRGTLVLRHWLTIRQLRFLQRCSPPWFGKSFSRVPLLLSQTSHLLYQVRSVDYE